MPGIGSSARLRRNVNLIQRGKGVGHHQGLAWRIAFAWLNLATLTWVTEPTPEQLELFEKKIRPVLVERCYKCHSARSEKLKGGLLLDSQEGVMKGGEDGPVITR